MDKITELLDKRHKERKEKLENLQEIKSKQVSANEGVEYFDSVYDEKVREIQNNLNNMTASDPNLAVTFSKIGQTLQDLQRFLSSSTFFLNDRKVQKCQEQLNDLSVRLDERKAQLVPKKKFGFRNKVKREPCKTGDQVDATVTASSPGLERVTEIKQFQYTIIDRNNESIFFTGPDANDKDLTVANLRSCVLKIDGHPGSLHVKNLHNCLVLSGPIARSFFAENCKNCCFVIACQQLRLHTSTKCDIYLHVTSRGIIEDSQEIFVAPYNYDYPSITEDFDVSGLPRDRNNWNDLADFNWLSAEQRSPNWGMIPESRLVKEWNQETSVMPCQL